MSLDSKSESTLPVAEATNLSQIAAELAALGESEADEEELALLAGRPGELPNTEDERFVGELFRMAEGVDPLEAELDELGSRRVWNEVREGHAHETPRAPNSGTPRVIWGVLFAAAALLVVVLNPGDEAPAGPDEGLGAVAHAGLDALGVDTRPGADARRTRELAETLGRTLEEQG